MKNHNKEYYKHAWLLQASMIQKDKNIKNHNRKIKLIKHHAILYNKYRNLYFMELLKEYNNK